jgi:hypothetical protein
MKIEIRKPNSDKVIAVTANRIAIQPPPDGSPYILTAEVDDGDSPIRILLDNGTSQPVKRLALTRRDTSFVKSFHKKGSRPHTVVSHYRKMPTSLQTYRRHLSPETKAKLAEAARKSWKGTARRKKFYATLEAKRAANIPGGNHGTHANV